MYSHCEIKKKPNKKKTNLPTVTTSNQNYTEGFSQCSEARKIKSVRIRKEATNVSLKDDMTLYT